MGARPRIPLSEAPRVEVESRAEWRRWLAANHANAGGIWLVTYKKHCGRRHLPWDDIVREALCFGWIDGQARKLDDDRTMRYLSPRRPGSTWSRRNKRHIESLIAVGDMQPPGFDRIEAAKRDGSWTLLDDIEDLIVPSDLARALDAIPTARANYEAFPDPEKKGLLWWIKTAKRPDTRARRIAATVRGAVDGVIATRAPHR